MKTILMSTNILSHSICQQNIIDSLVIMPSSSDDRQGWDILIR